LKLILTEAIECQTYNAGKNNQVEEFPAKLSLNKKLIEEIVEQTIFEFGDPDERVVT
jgi:hypothetical protein